MTCKIDVSKDLKFAQAQWQAWENRFHELAAQIARFEQLGELYARWNVDEMRAVVNDQAKADHEEIERLTKESRHNNNNFLVSQAVVANLNNQLRYVGELAHDGTNGVRATYNLIIDCVELKEPAPNVPVSETIPEEAARKSGSGDGKAGDLLNDWTEARMFILDDSPDESMEEHVKHLDAHFGFEAKKEGE